MEQNLFLVRYWQNVILVWIPPVKMEAHASGELTNLTNVNATPFITGNIVNVRLMLVTVIHVPMAVSATLLRKEDSDALARKVSFTI